MATKKSESKPFSVITERLEEIAQSLEGGEASLEQALELFEEGVRLSRLGSERLDAAEAKIEQLLQNDTVAPLSGQGE